MARRTSFVLFAVFRCGQATWRLAFAIGAMLATQNAMVYAKEPTDLIAMLRHAKVTAIGVDGTDVTDVVHIESRWEQNQWHGTISNRTSRPVQLRELVLFDGSHGLPPETPVYGEGFTMLSQTGGTLAQPTDEGFFTDRSHYKLPEPDELRTAYGFATLHVQPELHCLLGFTSCHKFIGRISFSETRLRVSLDLENMQLSPGATWAMEDLLIICGSKRARLLDQFATHIASHHPPIFQTPVPTGWCSWYCFGPDVRAQQIRDNLNWCKQHFPQLRYIQIDDGYQPWMGDWLATGQRFGGDVQAIIREIADLGFEPALWVAPMIASPQSKLFLEHPDWFVQDEHGHPLSSDRVGFGGWRLGPWYALDGTHPEAQKYLETLFATLRNEWGCRYFKLDANYWGTLPGGVRHDRNASRIEAYRQAMAAVRRGAGDAFLLGCNHPIWPSLGLLHGSRSSMDITRDWHHISKTGRENLLRGWQNGQLWWNDPDCLVLSHNQNQPLPEDDQRLFEFHATLIFATGGMLLTGDDMTTYGTRERAMLQKLFPPTGRTMDFADTRFTVGVLDRPSESLIALFRWDDTPEQLVVPVRQPCEVIDVWTGESLGIHAQPLKVELSPRSARLFKLTPQ